MHGQRGLEEKANDPFSLDLPAVLGGAGTIWGTLIGVIFLGGKLNGTRSIIKFPVLSPAVLASASLGAGRLGEDCAPSPDVGPFPRSIAPRPMAGRG
jgi:hypothetical protein